MTVHVDRYVHADDGLQTTGWSQVAARVRGGHLAASDRKRQRNATNRRPAPWEAGRVVKGTLGGRVSWPTFFARMARGRDVAKRFVSDQPPVKTFEKAH